MAYTTADVGAAIAAVTTDPREQAAMWYMCGAESGCDPNARQTGGGPGRGAWQIETTWLPESQSLNPYAAAQALYARWNVPGCTQAQGDTWNTNPQQAAHDAARCIGKAGVPYGPSQQQTAWGFVTQNVKGLAGAGGTLLSLPVVGGIASGAGGIVSFIENLFQQATWIRIALILAGLGLALIGLSAAMRDVQGAAARGAIGG